MSLILNSFFTFLLCFQVSDGWILEKKTSNIQMYTKKDLGDTYDQVKVVAQTKASISEVVAALEDLKNQVNWVYSTEKVEMIESIDDGHFIYHYCMEMPFPVKNRDAIIQYKRHQDLDSKIVYTKSRTIRHRQNLSEDYERIKYFTTTYEVKALSKEMVEIVYILKADPGVNLPSWLVKLFSTKGPYKSMVALVDLIEIGTYENSIVEGVVNY